MKKLLYGDNLHVMREKLGKHSVDLIYLDPPFKSDTNYNLLYRNMTGKPVPESVEAFFDTWELDTAKLEVARNMPRLMSESGVEDQFVQFWDVWIRALKDTQPELLAYLIYMVERLLHMKSLLRPTGSIYLHCDPTASHYLKVMMDGIFGHDNFRNEIIWKRTSAHSSARRYGPVHDTILFYTAGDKYTWNKLYQPYEKSYIEAFYTHSDPDGRVWRRSDMTGAGTRNGETGAVWRGIDVTAKGRHWAWPPAKMDEMDRDGRVHWPAKEGGMPMLKRYLDEQPGVPAQDIIDDIGPIHNMSSERLGYPTQKPIALLERIIQASTNKGDVVFDPFCGCGTTIYAAEKTEREWIGCDIAILSIRLIRDTLTGNRYRLVEGDSFVLDGVPASVDQAQELFLSHPLQFQHWIVERLGGFPMKKKVADRGIDGRMYFETRAGLKQVILSVKGGKLKPTDVRDLRGTMEREQAPMGALLSLQTPSKAMRQEAAEAGVFEYGGVNYDRIQLLTVEQIVERHQEIHMPARVTSRVADNQTSFPF